MKNHLLIGIALALVSCQTNDIISSGEIKSTNESTVIAEKTKGISIPDEQFQSLAEILLETKEVPTIENEETPSISNMLITHSRYAFIEYVDLDIEEMEGIADASDIYSTKSTICYTFFITDEKLSDRYESMIGQTLQVNNSDHQQYVTKIVDIVVVHDLYNEAPYVAAVLAVPQENDFYYAWTSEVANTSYPFRSTASYYATDEGDQLQSTFQGTPQFHNFKQIYSQPEEEVDLEMNIEEFEHYNGTQYQVIQYNAIGVCGGMVDNVTAVYTIENGSYELLAIAQLDYFFEDLIDIDHDGFPEILGADFAASAIISIKDGGYEEHQGVSWSTMGCPC